ncbi:MAG: glycoside hydrolase family 44 protein [Thermoanaerobaculia bacterium]
MKRYALGIVLLLLSTPWASAQLVVDVDAAADRRPISPLIYGVAFANTAELLELNVPLNRSGGNATSRYNWRINATNRAGDWYFESIADGPAIEGRAADDFVTQSRAGAAEPALTIPMVGWVAKLGASRSILPSFSVAKYGPQQSTDPWFPDAGNGVALNGTKVTNNDRSDASVPADEAFHAGWIEHLVSTWGASTAGGLRFLILDNKPSLWHETHRDVHPAGAGMDELRDRTIAWARMIHSIDPGVALLAPEEWGWSGYFYSGLDQQISNANGWTEFPDRDAHGGAWYLPWFLSQLRQHDQASGSRSIDVFTLHFYPQSGEFTSAEGNVALQELRNRSTRSLWDPGYVDESWIHWGPEGGIVRLIPRMKQWVGENYPGLKTGITEYNWGADRFMNGATAQADILGIFGREGLDLAARWTAPERGSAVYNAFRMYRNYDGRKSTFGDTSVRASSPDPDRLASFAAVRTSDGKLTIMLVNKALDAPAPVTVNVRRFTFGKTAAVWQLASNAITQLSPLPVAPRGDGGSISITLPAKSVTLLVIDRLAERCAGRCRPVRPRP